jgi:O-succinylbenzoic acid--CoA ligase
MDQFDIEQFNSNENIYLIPNYIKFDVKERILSEWKKLKLTDHVFILSSGTTSSDSIKTYAISKKSLFINARAVNEFLNINTCDTWISSLPYFHIGGLSIYARAFLSGNTVISYSKRWNAPDFYSVLSKENVNYLSLVPTQLYDLVRLNLKPPSSIKGVFIGGDFLSSTLREQALKLDWPIISTFGMTETCSQFASSFVGESFDEFLEVLPINSVSFTDSIPFLHSKAMYTASIIFSNDGVNCSFEEENYIKSLDLFELKLRDGKQFIKPRGRLGEEFKVNGRLVNFFDIKNSIYKIFNNYRIVNSADIQLVDDERKGKSLLLILESRFKSESVGLLEDVKASVGHLLDVNLSLVQVLELTASGKIKKH